ncbi:MAG TPA: hypothetical protein PKA64_25470 [Myxococcota bacterium]|nr:hypothetical protein [Myxococcota bacterium]
MDVTAVVFAVFVGAFLLYGVGTSRINPLLVARYLLLALLSYALVGLAGSMTGSVPGAPWTLVVPALVLLLLVLFVRA